jgi:hypothetical protein
VVAPSGASSSAGKQTAARRRKTLVVCRGCHEAIHHERPRRHEVKAQVTGEPLEIERCAASRTGPIVNAVDWSSRRWTPR